VKKLAAQWVPECDPRLFHIVLGKSVVPNSDAFAGWSAGRGGRFGQRTGYFFLARYAKLRGRTEDMLANLRQLVGVKPGWAEMETYEDALGDAYLELGRVDEAISEYERALRLFPGIARAR